MAGVLGLGRRQGVFDVPCLYPEDNLSSCTLLTDMQYRFQAMASSDPKTAMELFCSQQFFSAIVTYGKISLRCLFNDRVCSN